jgi:hypothetical protein
MSEALAHEVAVAEGSAVDFRLLLDYAYGLPIRLTESNLLPLLELAAAYQVEGLVGKCAGVLGGALDAVNCASVLQLADRFSLRSLKSRALDFALDQFPAVSAQPDFYDLSDVILRSLVEKDMLTNCEEDRVRACVCVCVYIYMYIYIYKYVYVYVYKCVCV